ncbi:MAG: DUF5060 domain-containing protein [Phycisphaerales bacterium]|nr:MAG: DUF5060 domain-containing protein [Phycisphaerales bacterium]
MKKLAYIVLLVVIAGVSAGQEVQVERWDVFELALPGPTEGNPFIGIEFSAVFRQGARTFEPHGFYDGDGTFRIRFMPDREGVWTYETRSNRAALSGKQGRFICAAPSPGNHGPVRVRNQYHFAYEDGAPFYPFGTTIYEWPFQSDERRQRTIETLKGCPFNKARFLVVPPWRQSYVEGPGALDRCPFFGTSKENWDFSRFDPEYFRRLEICVEQLRDLGIEADMILFRPYDHGKWGFDTMDAATNERFVRYVVARFAAYRNVWWSLANENSFIRHLTDEDWDHLFQVVQEADPHQHLRSIHNAGRIYDHRQPWVTHVSLQYYMAVRALGVSPLLRDIYRKPIVHDEINYEGTITKRWGQLTGEEMVYRFWSAIIGGAYATHGETRLQPDGDGWISRGGTLQGQSPARIAFLREIVEAGPAGGLKPIDQYYENNMAGELGRYYLIYFGKDAPTQWAFKLPDSELETGMRFRADIIDTWHMTVSPVECMFEVEPLDRYSYIDKDRATVGLPGRPYMALRIRRVE